MTLSDMFPIPHICTLCTFIILIGFLIKTRYVYILRSSIYLACHEAEKECVAKMNALTNVGTFGIMLQANLTGDHNLQKVQSFINRKYDSLTEISNEVDFYESYVMTLPPYYKMLFFTWNYVGIKNAIIIEVDNKKDVILNKIKFLKNEQDYFLDLIEQTKDGLIR